MITGAATPEPSTTPGQDTFILPSDLSNISLSTTSRLLVRHPTRAPPLSLRRLGKDPDNCAGYLYMSHRRPRPSLLLVVSTQSAAIDYGAHTDLGAAGAARRSSCVSSRWSAEGSGSIADRGRHTVAAETQGTVPAYHRYVRLDPVAGGDGTQRSCFGEHLASHKYVLYCNSNRAW